MARMPRTISSTDLYHLMTRGVARCIIFEDDADREMLLGLLHDDARDAAVQIYAWCLLDNHYHLLVRGDMEDISAMMLKVNSRYARYFNTRHGRVGHLFQDRFGSEPVETEDYLLTVVRYIQQNPIKAELCDSCDYPWSSYGTLRDDSWPDPQQPAAQLFDSREVSSASTKSSLPAQAASTSEGRGEASPAKKPSRLPDSRWARPASRRSQACQGRSATRPSAGSRALR